MPHSNQPYTRQLLLLHKNNSRSLSKYTKAKACQPDAPAAPVSATVPLTGVPPDDCPTNGCWLWPKVATCIFLPYGVTLDRHCLLEEPRCQHESGLQEPVIELEFATIHELHVCLVLFSPHLHACIRNVLLSGWRSQFRTCTFVVSTTPLLEVE
jgi:hypothetical protein